MARRKSVIHPNVANGIAILISCVWATSFIADILKDGYDVNPLVHFIMVIAAGAAFNVGISRNGKSDNGKEGNGTG